MQDVIFPEISRSTQASDDDNEHAQDQDEGNGLGGEWLDADTARPVDEAAATLRLPVVGQLNLTDTINLSAPYLRDVLSDTPVVVGVEREAMAVPEVQVQMNIVAGVELDWDCA